MVKLITIALAPVLIIAGYVYARDKYEKEPLKLLLKALVLGGIISIPVIFVESLFARLISGLPKDMHALGTAFLVAGFTEEVFKFLVLFLLIWKNRNFNEKFDGIVYAVFISLGFAAVENIIYVVNYGDTTGYTRALISVPAHALFGVTMGYYFGLAKFYPLLRKSFMIRSFLYPFLLHGIFDFILMLQNYRLLLGFIPFVIFLYIDGLKKMRILSGRSIYRDDSPKQKKDNSS
jgi:protease PrsW